MERSGQGPTSSSFRRASWPCWTCTGGALAPTAATARHRCWNAAGHMYVFVCVYVYVVSECVLT